MGKSEPKFMEGNCVHKMKCKDVSETCHLDCEKYHKFDLRELLDSIYENADVVRELCPFVVVTVLLECYSYCKKMDLENCVKCKIYDNLKKNGKCVINASEKHTLQLNKDDAGGCV